MIAPILWMLKVALTGLFVSQKMAPFVCKPGHADLMVLKAWIEAGKVTPVIEQRLPLAEAAEAVRHVAAGHAQGKTVIVVRDA